jgi:hypothetical protein
MRGFGVWLCAFGGCLLLCGAPALAKEVHVYRSAFGAPGSGPGQFTRPLGVAVNDRTHEVYVVDSGNKRVERFDAGGSTFLGEFSGVPGAPTGALSEPTEIAVDNSGNPSDASSEDVYVVDRGHGVIDKFEPNGTYIGQLTGSDTPGGAFEPGQATERSIEGVAVDPSGTVWVTIYKGPVYSFADTLQNGYDSERETAFGGGVEGLAVDGEDNLYFHTGKGEFAKVNDSGETLLNPFSGDKEAFRIAVDPIGHEVYLDNLNNTIEAFAYDASPIESCIAPEHSCFGSGHLSFSAGVAVDAGTGEVYASDVSSDTVSSFEGIILPDVAITALSEQHTRSVTLNGTVNPHGRAVTSCVFEYGTTSAYGHSVACSPASLGSGTSAVAVHAHLAGLEPESEYHYRLVAENGAPESSATQDQTLFTGPALGGESVSDVASSSATLQDTINPKGADTHYYIEYGPTIAYGFYAPLPPPGEDIGSAEGVRSVSVHIQGLEGGSIYHYRFVAVEDGESFGEGDSAFTTQSASISAALPDGRAWELVSPANKRGAVLELTERGGLVQAANDGGAITYIGEGPSVTQSAAGNLADAQILSRRGPAGWQSADLTLPGRLPEDGEPAESLFALTFDYRLFSSDLSSAAVEPQRSGTPALSSGVSERTLYLRDNEDGTFAPLVSAANVPEGTKIEEEGFIGTNPDPWEMHFLAATPDLAHVVFKTPKALTAEATDEETVKGNAERGEGHSHTVQWNLYEWSRDGLRLINILPPPGNEVAHGRYANHFPLVRLAGMIDTGGRAAGGAQRSVSADGRRIAWTWGEPYTPQELESYRGLYVRDMVEQKSVRVGGASAVYQSMNSDGSKIFYLEHGDLYEYNWSRGSATDLTATHGGGEPNAGVQELVSGVSEDGSHVYFVATGALAGRAVSGEENLYVLHDTSGGWTTTLIAALSQQDRRSWYGWLSIGVPSLAQVSSRVSPNGRYFAFMSQRSLTGYDNRDAVSGAADEEVFLYDAQQDRLVCASCNPTGARPVGVFDGEESKLLVDRTEAWTAKGSEERDRVSDHWLAASVPGWDEPGITDPVTYQPRYLSDSGRLFFDSPDALAPQDTNGLEDVYEYEPVSVGDCVAGGASFSEGVRGCVSLISSGTSSAESAFYDASENGDDVFFTTTGKLVPQDYDKGYDVYDAHVCTTSVPCVEAPVISPPCSSGDSCKAVPSPQPEVFGAPPSATFIGAGNILAAPVPRPRSLPAAERLARALKACRKKGARRRACERQARKRYPVKRTIGKSTAGAGRRG